MENNPLCNINDELLAVLIPVSNQQLQGEFVEVDRLQDTAAPCNGHCVTGQCRSALDQ